MAFQCVAIPPPQPALCSCPRLPFPVYFQPAALPCVTFQFCAWAALWQNTPTLRLITLFEWFFFPHMVTTTFYRSSTHPTHIPHTPSFLCFVAWWFCTFVTWCCALFCFCGIRRALHLLCIDSTFSGYAIYLCIVCLACARARGRCDRCDHWDGWLTRICDCFPRLPSPTYLHSATMVNHCAWARATFVSPLLLMACYLPTSVFHGSG